MQWGKLARAVFENPVDVFKTAGADTTTPPVPLPERNAEPAKVITSHKGAKAPSAGSVKAMGSDDAPLATMQKQHQRTSKPVPELSR